MNFSIGFLVTWFVIWAGILEFFGVGWLIFLWLLCWGGLVLGFVGYGIANRWRRLGWRFFGWRVARLRERRKALAHASSGVADGKPVKGRQRVRRSGRAAFSSNVHCAISRNEP